MYFSKLMKLFEDNNKVVVPNKVDPNISQGQEYLNTIKNECVQLKGNLNVIEGFESKSVNLTDRVGEETDKNVKEIQMLEQEFQTKLQAYIQANHNYNNVVFSGLNTTYNPNTNCPQGYSVESDGLTCKSKAGLTCTLNEVGRGMPRCRYVGYCPAGYENIGDGSACKKGTDRCALYGNPALERCNDLNIKYTKCPDGYTNKTGIICEKTGDRDVTCSLNEDAQGVARCRFIGKCPTGYENRGNGSACFSADGKSCSLTEQGNGDIPRCKNLLKIEASQTQTTAEDELMNLATTIYNKLTAMKQSISYVDDNSRETIQKIDESLSKYGEYIRKTNSMDLKTGNLDAMLTDNEMRLKANNMQYVTWGIIGSGLLLFTLHYLRN